MQIMAEGLAKKFNKHWVFRGFTYTFYPGKTYAITGANGSGKTTLLTVLTSSNHPTKGKLQYLDPKNQAEIPVEKVFNKISWVGPYTHTINELTAEELFDFYTKFKPMVVSKKAFFDILNLNAIANKAIALFSSGMQQKVKLALAFLADVEVIFLDEPTSFLDQSNIAWYYQMFESYKNQKTIIVSSNQAHEYEQCQNIIDIAHYK